MAEANNNSSDSEPDYNQMCNLQEDLHALHLTHLTLLIGQQSEQLHWVSKQLFTIPQIPELVNINDLSPIFPETPLHKAQTLRMPSLSLGQVKFLAEAYSNLVSLEVILSNFVNSETVLDDLAYLLQRRSGQLRSFKLWTNWKPAIPQQHPFCTFINEAVNGLSQLEHLTLYNHRDTFCYCPAPDDRIDNQEYDQEIEEVYAEAHVLCRWNLPLLSRLREFHFHSFDELRLYPQMIDRLILSPRLGHVSLFNRLYDQYQRQRSNYQKLSIMAPQLTNKLVHFPTKFWGFNFTTLHNFAHLTQLNLVYQEYRINLPELAQKLAPLRSLFHLELELMLGEYEEQEENLTSNTGIPQLSSVKVLTFSRIHVHRHAQFHSPYWVHVFPCVQVLQVIEDKTYVCAECSHEALVNQFATPEQMALMCFRKKMEVFYEISSIRAVYRIKFADMKVRKCSIRELGWERLIEESRKLTF